MTADELEKIHVEVAKLMAETRKLNAEAAKLRTDSVWYPVAVAGALMAATATVLGVIIKWLVL